MRYLLPAAAMVVVGVTGSVHACSICVGYPQQSAADVLIESPCVVLAREDPAQPFSYAPIEVLRASDDVGHIDLLLDSQTRRILSSDPGRVVVLARDGKDSRWRNLGVADAAYVAVVRRLVAFAPQWRGLQGNAQRVEFFLPLFGHENLKIHELAYLELARAPYETIKRLARAVPRASIEPILRNPIYIEWRALAILLLAQSPEATDKQYILESFRSAERIGLTRHLAAWAAASIEVQGADAVSFIQRCYFCDPDRKQDELVEVVKAMSLHGTEGRTELRDQIVSSYDVLLDAHPQMIEYIVKDLIAWKRPELTQRISTIEAKGAKLDLAAKKAIRQYLGSTASGQ
jgi:hypothetical protein